jgi:hypothetical protein
VTSLWVHIQVELESGAGIECDPRPGRIFVVGPGHTFLQLASAIDDAFARWDVAHLHAFELSDGRLVGLPDEDGLPRARRWLDHRRARVTHELAPGDAFIYTFDLAERWRHCCQVLEQPIDDPLALYGTRPRRPAIVFGWGWIPDQYGRTRADEGA